ncbi:hypothetical protein SJDPG2_00270 [Porphyromonas gingivalis SJD2]|nr:hypothetical protein SJDPG2_00270 [Porphyromonas gingivalis SJD2]OWR76910.1 hypothetical protein SJDPG5_01390 [Porphyromonas gingivalis SJD5]
MPGNENSAFFIEFFLGLPLEDNSTIESISINRYPTDTSRKSSDCGASFLKKVVPEFFRFGSRFFYFSRQSEKVYAPRFSKLQTRKFRHVNRSAVR